MIPKCVKDIHFLLCADSCFMVMLCHYLCETSSFLLTNSTVSGLLHKMITTHNMQEVVCLKLAEEQGG